MHQGSTNFRRDGNNANDVLRREQELARVIRRSLAEFGERRMTPDLERRIAARAVALYSIRDELV